MMHCNPKEYLPALSISIIVLLSPLSGSFYRGLSTFGSYMTAAIILSTCLAVFCIQLSFSRNGKCNITVSVTDALIGIYLLYGVLNTVLLHKTVHEPLFYVKWIMLAMLYITARLIPQNGSRILLFLLVVGGIVQAAVVLGQYSGIIGSLNGNFEVTGSFANPAHVAIYLSGSIIAAIILLKQRAKTLSKAVKPILIIFIAILFAALCVCKSRTAFIALLAALLVIAFQSEKFRNLTKISRSMIISAGAILVLSAAVGSYYLRPKSADARMLIWKVSAQIFKQSPVFGNGSESFGNVYMYKQAEYFNANPNSKYATVANNNYQSFNEFIHIACEQGIIGLILFLSIIGYTFFKRRSVIIKPLLALLLASSCFLYIADIFPVLILFPLVLGIADDKNDKYSCIIRGQSMPRICLSATSVLFFAILFYSCHCKYRYDSIHKRLAQNGLCQKLEIQEIMHSADYDIVKRNKDFSLFFAKLSYNSLTPEAAAGVILDIANSGIVTSTMMSDLGILYQKRKMYSEAEKYYKLASDMVPGRITPNYMLFKLYVETGDEEMAKMTAKRILSQPVKITGGVVLRIKKEIRDWLSEIETDKNYLPDKSSLRSRFTA